MSRLTEYLRAELKRKRIKQCQLAIRMGHDERTVNRILLGERSLTPRMAVKFEYALGVVAVELLHMQAVDQIAEAKREYENSRQSEFERNSGRANLPPGYTLANIG